ncbi:SusE domain-containing protein [Flavobacterium sp.]|jgi:hypothetical protein|uniref:SusE domain-containing protein n=1 Tax=Flavobacterium sp. TaxID=239 RepID=UPI0037BF13AE
MKNKIIALFIAAIGLTSLNSCEDENFELTSPEGSFRITTPLNGESVVLSETTLTNPGLSITWSAMSYTTPTSVSYTVEIAKDGTDFAAPIELGTTTNLFASFQTGDFNLKCLMSGAVPFVQTAINVRIKATSGTTGSQPVYSNSITYLVTCFGCLNQYAVGQGLPQSGWNWNNPRTLLCDNGVLSMTADFLNGTNDTFRFFTTEGDWNTGRNYPYYSGLNYKIVSTLVNAADGDQNFRNTGVAGKYKLTIDSNNKTINIARRTLTSGNLDLEPTSNWLVGAATPGGWSWAGNNETELGQVDTGIFEVALELKNNDTFRVFLGNNGGDSWGLGDRNFPWYVNNGYTIDSELANAADGDSNFRYTGPTGVRLFKINSITKVITVD